MKTEHVRSFYDRFSYPFSEVKDATSLNGAAYLKVLEFECRARGYAGKSFLDVGCGSGHRILELAKAYPKADFTAIDISGKSIEIAIAQASKDSVTNIRFHQADLHEFQADRRFDVISAIGVMHHLPNFELGIEALSDLLNDRGVLVAWLYHSYGELDKTLRRQALKMLSRADDELNVSMRLAREIGGAIDPERYGKSYGQNLTPHDHDSKDADAFLNPIVETFTFGKVLEAFRACDFQWAAIDQVNFQKSGFFLNLTERESKAIYTLDIAAWIGGKLALDRFFDLPLLDRLRVLERLILPTGFTVVAGHGESWSDASNRLVSGRIAL